MSSAFTIEDLQELERAIAKGVTAVSYAGGSVNYRSLAEMFELRKMMQEELLIQAPRKRWSRVRFGRGD